MVEADAAASAPWRVVIADDEPLARLRLRTLLARHARFEVVAECADGRETLDALAVQRVDVLFLDIRMPELNGVAVAESIVRDAEDDRRAPRIIFVTAYDSHAVQAFDLDAVDYLVKPVALDRFDRAMERLTEELTARSASRAAPPGTPGDAALHTALAALASLRPGGRYPPRFAVRDAKGIYFVAAADIERIDAEGNYVGLWANGRQHLLRESMRAIEDKLDPERFVRVHRSTIVAIDRIVRMEPWGHGEYLVTLADGSRVTSSRTYGAQLQALIRASPSPPGVHPP
jgi:two-component system, LytTR family, response regulator